MYEIDGRLGLIEDVIPLLDRGYGIGQMMPAGYSYYNVPYQYRDYYYDTDDYSYRYAPGAIYQVDRDSAADHVDRGAAYRRPFGGPAASCRPIRCTTCRSSYRDRYYDSRIPCTGTAMATSTRSIRRPG